MKGLLLVLPWWGVSPRIYYPPGPYESTQKGVGIHIKSVVACQPDGKQFVNHLRSSIPSGVVSVRCNKRLVELGTPLET